MTRSGDPDEAPPSATWEKYHGKVPVLSLLHLREAEEKGAVFAFQSTVIRTSTCHPTAESKIKNACGTPEAGHSCIQRSLRLVV
eukprot:273664-Amphidinium_carterae.1